MRGWIIAGLVVLAIASTRSDAGDVGGIDTDGWLYPSAGVEESRAATERRAAEQAYLRRTAHALAETSAPRELAFAALLQQAAARPVPPPPGDVIDTSVTRVQFDGFARGWRQRAATRAGDDVIAKVLLIAGADRMDRISQGAAQRNAGRMHNRTTARRYCCAPTCRSMPCCRRRLRAGTPTALIFLQSVGCAMCWRRIRPTRARERLRKMAHL